MSLSARRVFPVVLMLILAACSAPQPIQVIATPTLTATPEPTPIPTPTPIPYRDTIVIGLGQEPRTLHPFLDDSPVGIHILDALYERYITSLDFAYQADPNGGLLADTPTLENGGAVLDDGGTPEDPVDDQLTVTFNMLPGPAWCDGVPVTAHDSVYAFNLANDPDSGVVSRLALERVESYTAIDDQTVQVKLKPGQLDPAYTSYFWTPLPEHIWGKLSALDLQTAPAATNKPCGYGPYTIAGAEDQGAGWIAGESITLAANPHYFRGAPKTRRLVFKFIPGRDRLVAQVMSGEIDIATSDGLNPLQLPLYADFERHGRIDVVALHGPAWEQLVFNLYAPTNFDSNSRAQPHPILGDARVRQAIAYAIDRQALVERVYGGQSIVLHQARVFPTHPLYAPKTDIRVYPFEPQRAASLLEEAGWTDTDGDGVRECQGCGSGAKEGARLSLTYRTTSSSLRSQVVGRVQADLQAVGFDIRLELLPREVLFGDVTGLIVGDFEIAQFSELADADPGGERQYGCDWIPTPDNGWYGENYSGWCSPAADRALIEAGRSLRLDDRRAAYAGFQREFTRELPALPLFPRVAPFLVSLKLENFKPNDFMPSVTWNAFELGVPSD